MKLRKWILILAAIAVTASSISGCVVVPAHGYYYHDYHGWDHNGWDRR
jgi:hypothetical protein